MTRTSLPLLENLWHLTKSVSVVNSNCMVIIALTICRLALPEDLMILLEMPEDGMILLEMPEPLSRN